MEGTFKVIFDLLSTASPLVAMICLWMWWLERGERRERQTELKEVTKTATDGLSNVAASIKDLAQLLQRAGRR